MIFIYYIVFVILALIFTKHMYTFLRYFYSRPLLTNTYAEFIPSKQIIDDYIIENKDGSYSCVICFKGFPYFKTNNPNKTQEENLRIKERALNFVDLKEETHIKFIFKRTKNQDGYSNDNYLEITSYSKSHIKEISSRLVNGLSDYKPKLLQNKDLIEFLFFNCNLVRKSIQGDMEVNINDLCSYSYVNMEDDFGILQNIDTKKYFKCLSFNYGSSIEDSYFSKLITSNIECDFIINTKFFQNLKAKSIISEDKRNISASNDASKDGGVMSKFFNSSNKKISETAQAQEILDNDNANLTVCDIFIIVFADTEEELSLSINKLKELISKYEIFLIDEKRLLNFFFLQRLIGFKLHHTMKFLIPHADYLIYAKKMLSQTIAGLFDYIDMPVGLNKCDWGEKPIANFSTNYNNLYKFYLHISEEKTSVGHGVVIAPTGGGKTTFIQYLMKGIIDNYNDIDVYSFDRFNGISVFTNWIKGEDINFLDLAINPLQVDLEKDDNKEFLYNFLSMLSKAESIEDKEDLENFINIISLLPTEERILKNLIENNVIPPCRIRDNLTIWASGNYSKYVNAPEDKFSLEGQFLNFQMDKILDDEELSAPIIYYIMFKIRQKARETSRGHFIFIDESAKMIRNKYFRKQIDVLLTEHRKLRGCVWLAFQNPSMFLEPILSGKDTNGNDVFESIKELVLSQCQNQALFTGDGISENILEQLGINLSVYNEVLEAQKTHNHRYFILLKRPQENVILNVNLQEKLGDNLKFLSSSVDDVNRMRVLKEQYGESWYEHF